MATIRHHAHIARPAAEVWAIVEDPGDIDSWLPGIDACTLDGDVRTISTMGIEIKEQILVNDPELRRMQYTIVAGPVQPEHHLATIDVIENGDETVFVYSCDVRPDDLGALFDGVYKAGAEAIKERAES
jgi:hypothetical protein